MLRLERREQSSRLMVYLTPVLALGLTLASGLLLFSLMGFDAPATLYAFFIQPISDAYGVSELFLKAIPLVLIGVGLSIGFRAGVWNIGAEGQLTMGAIAAGGLAVHFYDTDSSLILVAMFILGIIGGMFWAAIPAWLKTRFNTNEILTSLMLTYVAVLLLSYLVHGPWRDPDGYNFPESRLFEDAAIVPVIIEGMRLHIGAIITLLVVIAGWILLSRTLIGFQIKVIGEAPTAAHFAGFSGPRLIWLVLLLSGGLAGLAGMLEVSGPIGQLLPNISPGYGFTAIIVAFVGRLHPLGVLIAGLLLALSYLGGETIQIEMGLPDAVTGVFQGLLLFFLLACDILILYRLRWERRT